MRLMSLAVVCAALTLAACQQTPTDTAAAMHPMPQGQHDQHEHHQHEHHQHGKHGHHHDQNAVALTDTRWTLSSIDGQPISNVTAERTPYLQFNAADQRLSGLGGCNRLAGNYAQQGSSLSMMIASTRMACMNDNGLEGRFLQALSATASYAIEGNTLRLIDAQGQTRLRLTTP